MSANSKLKINSTRDFADLKKNLTLAQLTDRIEFSEDILGKGLVLLLEKELEQLDRCATSAEVKAFALQEM